MSYLCRGRKGPPGDLLQHGPLVDAILLTPLVQAERLIAEHKRTGPDYRQMGVGVTW